MATDSSVSEIHIHDGACVCEECDWPENRKWIMSTMRRSEQDVKEIRNDLREIRGWMVEHGGDPPAEIITGAIEKALKQRKDTGPLTRTDIEKIVNEARNGKGKRGWEPWMYVALGGGLAFGSNVFVELVRVVAG